MRLNRNIKGVMVPLSNHGGQAFCTPLLRARKGNPFVKVVTACCLLYTVIIFSACNQSGKLSVKANDSNRVVPIEIIMRDTAGFDMKGLKVLCDNYKIIHKDITRWNNRIIILARSSSLSSGEFLYWLNQKCRYPGDSIVVFKKPFYTFDRSTCSDTIHSKQWDNIILTANLVADTKLQQEYLDYHKTQFQKWPEVSKGFCNAHFQHLLVFKNGRQLIIVISIPKGKTLDELNPLTTKNNPRVDEWNKIMSKYQEGLPGTKTGETWVFLKPVG